jgi:hypothetical protein
MRHAVRIHILPIAIAVAIGSPSGLLRAQNPADGRVSATGRAAIQVLDRIAERLNTLRARVGPSHGAAGRPGGSPDPLDTAKHDVDWLRNSLTNSARTSRGGSATQRGAAISQAMLNALQADDDALGILLGASAEQNRALLEATFDDLHLKFMYCRARPEGMAALVKLSVHTWDGDKEVRQWQVAYLNAPLAILRRDESQPFPRFSSPTETQLPPGRYLIWAQDPQNGAKRGPAKELALGRDGMGSLQADVMVPRP